MVAGVGFEPHDLQVMSLTSYRAALSRHISVAGDISPARGGPRSRDQPRCLFELLINLIIYISGPSPYHNI